MLYADIIVDISHESIDRTFQYRIPKDLEQLVSTGVKVSIPFGNRKSMTGYVIGLSSVPKIPEDRIKDIISVVNKSVDIDERMIELASWIRTNFGGTMNDALKTVLPVKRSIRPVVKREIVLKCDEDTLNKALAEAEKKHHVAKARLLKELLESKVLPYDMVCGKLNISAATITSVKNAGLIDVAEVKDKKNIERVKAFPLNDEQRAAADAVINDRKNGIFGKYLVYGVTGSGKTEVYLEMIESVINEGKQVIVLIPEIALTFQTVMRFTRRFGDRVAFFNSRLSEGERYEQYNKAKNGEIDIMIGPRSALFTPFERLGLIVIDEEHEGAYKSEGVPKYHARPVAEKICELTGASLVLGSATPSLESFKKAKDGEYKLLKLTKRAKHAMLPTIKIVDLREELKKKNRSIFSLDLVNEMEKRLEKHEQILLFINRRGYSGFVSCRTCGEAVKCPHCSVSLTQHYDGSLKCHYCGYEVPKITACPACGSPYIAAFGTGTQKIEENVKKLFPAARVLRMDADTTKEKDSYDKILSAFSNEEADILIGTQMIVKGHDFPRVTLVGILAADLSLHVSDFRAAERTFELLAQAAGRAGRDELKGDVIIQTYKPDHYAITTAADQDYDSFYEREMAYRSLLDYPPAGHMMAVLYSGINESETLAACQNAIKEAIDKYKDYFDNGTVKIKGPVKASVSKVNDHYRFVVYFMSFEYAALTRVAEVFEERSKESKNISVFTDFDPMNTY